MVNNLRSEFDPHRHLRRKQVLKVVTNEKGQASGAVLTIRY